MLRRIAKYFEGRVQRCPSICVVRTCRHRVRWEECAACSIIGHLNSLTARGAFRFCGCAYCEWLDKQLRHRPDAELTIEALETYCEFYVAIAGLPDDLE
jgi:hypothetical protein